MPTRESKITTTVRLEESVYSELTRISKEEVRSINNLIEYALTKFVRDYQAGQCSQLQPLEPSSQ